MILWLAAITAYLCVWLADSKIYLLNCDPHQHCTINMFFFLNINTRLWTWSTITGRVIHQQAELISPRWLRDPQMATLNISIVAASWKHHCNIRDTIQSTNMTKTTYLVMLLDLVCPTTRGVHPCVSWHLLISRQNSGSAATCRGPYNRCSLGGRVEEEEEGGLGGYLGRR